MFVIWRIFYAILWFLNNLNIYLLGKKKIILRYITWNYKTPKKLIYSCRFHSSTTFSSTMLYNPIVTLLPANYNVWKVPVQYEPSVCKMIPKVAEFKTRRKFRLAKVIKIALRRADQNKR